MRSVHILALALCLAAIFAQPALARPPCADPAKLGVSRTVVIDTATAPRFGTQYDEASFLAAGEVALTFDDGPLRVYTKPILDALAMHCTKATFFLVGTAALPDPQLVREIARRGHTIATHTWSHPNLQTLTPEEAQAEIEKGISAVSLALGKPIAPLFRFPYLRDTDATLAHLKERKHSAIGVDVDGRDFEAKDASAVVELALKELLAKGKGIILMHDIHAVTAAAVPLLLAELKGRGFKVVHLKAKEHARTLAKYDAMVRQEAERLRSASSPNVARGAKSWPVLLQNAPAAAPAPRPPARTRVDGGPARLQVR